MLQIDAPHVNFWLRHCDGLIGGETICHHRTAIGGGAYRLAARGAITCIATMLSRRRRRRRLTHSPSCDCVHGAECRFRSGFKYVFRWLPCVSWHDSDALGICGPAKVLHHAGAAAPDCSTSGGVGGVGGAAIYHRNPAARPAAVRAGAASVQQTQLRVVHGSVIHHPLLRQQAATQ